MITAFWSTHHGQACTTTNTVAVTCMSALLRKGKHLAAHTHVSRSTLEQCLFPPRELIGHEAGDFANRGMDALLRLSRSGRLNSGMVPDYTWSLLRENRLDVLPGTQKPTRPESGEGKQILNVFRTAGQHYDHVAIDVHSGLDMEGTHALLQGADCLVICLNQNQRVLESWFSDNELRGTLERPSTLILLGRYDNEADVTPANIARKYGIPRTRVLPVPYSAALMQACNHGTVYDFLARHVQDARSPERELMDSLKRVTEQLPDGGVA